LRKINDKFTCVNVITGLIAREIYEMLLTNFDGRKILQLFCIRFVEFILEVSISKICYIEVLYNIVIGFYI